MKKLSTVMAAFRLSREIVRAIEKAAKAQGVSKSDIVRNILSAHFEK